MSRSVHLWFMMSAHTPSVPFVHVYVDRITRRPTELPEAFVQALKALQVPAAA